MIDRKSPNFDLSIARFLGKNGYEHCGLHWECHENRNKVIVIHCHGTLGNFYQNSFLEKFAATYTSSGISFLAFNFRTHDALAEGYFHDRVNYVGGSLIKFDSCVEDISTAIEWTRRNGYHKVIIQGHSLGCERVIMFNRSTENPVPCILLMPVNSRLSQSIWCRKKLGNTIDDQIYELRSKISNELLWNQYGSTSEDQSWSYQIPIFRDTLVDFLTGDAINMFDPILSNISKLNSTLVISSDEDHFHYGTFDKQKEFFYSILSTSSKFIQFSCEHDFDGIEMSVANCCVSWINSGLPRYQKDGDSSDSR